MVGRGDVAVLGLAVAVLGLLRGRDGHERAVQAVGVELLVGGVGVLVDVEAHAGHLGRLAVGVVGEGLGLHVLAVLPLALHLERAVADGGVGKGGVVVTGAGTLGHGREDRGGAHVVKVGVGLGELHLQRVVVRAGDAGKLGGGAGRDVLVALHHGQVVGDVGGLLARGGVAQAPPGVGERLCRHLGAVVELRALADLERPDGVVVAVGVALGHEVGELAGLVVVVGEGVEQVEGHGHGVLVLERVGLDARGVLDVVGEHGV